MCTEFYTLRWFYRGYVYQTNSNYQTLPSQLVHCCSNWRGLISYKRSKIEKWFHVNGNNWYSSRQHDENTDIIQKNKRNRIDSKYSINKADEELQPWSCNGRWLKGRLMFLISICLSIIPILSLFISCFLFFFFSTLDFYLYHRFW